MDGFEFFGAGSGSEEIDPAAFEKFKERIKAAAAQIKELKKGEQKKRVKEDKLVKILLHFVKNHQKQDIMMLIARLLEQNVPAVFILSVVLLGNEEVQKESGFLLNSAQGSEIGAENDSVLAKIDESGVLPLKLKIEIDAWMKNILMQALENPHNVIKTCFDEDGMLILPLIQLSAFIIRDYMEENKQNANYESLKQFSMFFLNGIMKKVTEKIENQKELNEGEL